jgi:hypothetical protein
MLHCYVNLLKFIDSYNLKGRILWYELYVNKAVKKLHLIL